MRAVVNRSILFLICALFVFCGCGKTSQASSGVMPGSNEDPLKGKVIVMDSTSKGYMFDSKEEAERLLAAPGDGAARNLKVSLEQEVLEDSVHGFKIYFDEREMKAAEETGRQPYFLIGNTNVIYYVSGDDCFDDKGMLDIAAMTESSPLIANSFEYGTAGGKFTVRYRNGDFAEGAFNYKE